VNQARTKVLIVVLLVLGSVLLGGLLAYWFFTTYEKVSEEVDIGFHGEARSNPLLAAQRFFETYQVPVNSHEGLVQLPPQDTTLIVPTQRLEMGPNEAGRYLHWIEAGGHMVVAASRGYYKLADRQDALLELVGIGQVENTFTYSPAETQASDDDTSDEDTTDAQVCPAPSNPDGAQFLHDNLVYVDWPGSNALLTMMMNDYYRLDTDAVNYPSVLTLEDEIGVYLVRLQIGKGYLTVLYNSYFMFNNDIKKYDNAEFLWRVAQIDTTPRPVWLVYSDDMPSLAVWLARFAWTALSSFGVFIIVWLWYASRRFGPVLPPLPQARRRLLEHVEATGRFLWQHDNSQQLYQGVNHALLRTLEIRHPAWLSKSAEQLQQRLAEISHLPFAQVQQAMTFSHVHNEFEFTKTIQTLEHIRKSL
jgi:hypothetical protein